MKQENLNYFASMAAYSDEELLSLFDGHEEEEPMNPYEAATNEFCYTYMRYPKTFAWKGFKKFGWMQQQLLCEKWNIILTDHETRNEKIIRLSKKITLKNFNKGIDKFNKGVDDFMKVIESTSKEKDLSIPDIKLANFKEISSLLGSTKESRKRKGKKSKGTKRRNPKVSESPFLSKEACDFLGIK